MKLGSLTLVESANRQSRSIMCSSTSRVTIKAVTYKGTLTTWGPTRHSPYDAGKASTSCHTCRDPVAPPVSPNDQFTPQVRSLFVPILLLGSLRFSTRVRFLLHMFRYRSAFPPAQRRSYMKRLSYLSHQAPEQKC